MPNLIPAALAEIISTHKALFGGFTMMADEGAAADPPAATETPQEPTAVAPEVEQLGDGGKAALAAERTARREADKQLKAALARLQEFEDRDKSEAQKQAEAAQATANERDAALAEAARLRAAVKFKLTEDDLTHLDGIPADRVEAIAEWVASRTATTTAPAAPSAAGQGNVGKPIGAGTIAEQLQQQIDAASKAGRHAEAIALKRQLSTISRS